MGPAVPLRVMKRWRERISSQENPGRFLVSRLLWRSRLCRVLPIFVDVDGTRIRFHPSALSAELWLNPRLLDEDLNFFRSYLRRGDTVIDVGANIGALSLAASRLVGEPGAVLSFEPHPQTFSYLKDNIDLNRATNVVAYQVALGAVASSGSISNLKSSDQNFVSEIGVGMPISIVPLDDFTAGLDEISLLKVDVEGFEQFVFRGARSTLERTSCIYYECSDDQARRYAFECADNIAFLNELGFRSFRWTPAGLTAVQPDAGAGLIAGNLVALRSESDIKL